MQWTRSNDAGQKLIQIFNEMPFDELNANVSKTWMFDIHHFAGQHPEFNLFGIQQEMMNRLSKASENTSVGEKEFDCDLSDL